MSTGWSTATHIKVLGTLHVSLGALGILGSIFIMWFFDGIAAMIAYADPSSDNFGAITFLHFLFALSAILFFVISLPGVIGGAGLLLGFGWARILLIVVSGLLMLEFPVGTVLGIYGLWVLLGKDAKRIISPPISYRGQITGNPPP